MPKPISRRFVHVAWIIFAIAGCTLGDDTPPGAPKSVTYDAATRTLSWIATGDDGDQGRGALTDIRAVFPPADVIQESFNPENIAESRIFDDTPRAGLPGTPRSFLVPRLSIGRPPFLMVAQRDEVANVGPFTVPASTDPNADDSVYTDFLETICGLATAPGSVSIAEGELDGQPGRDLVIGDADNLRVYVFYGELLRPYDLLPRARFCEPDAILDGSRLGGRFGAGVAVGDVDGDGSAEIFIGAPEYDRGDGLGQRGAIFVVRVSGAVSAPGDQFSVNEGPQQGFIASVRKTVPPFLELSDGFPESIAGNRQQSWSYYGRTPVMTGSDVSSGTDSLRHIVSGKELDGIQPGWLFAILSGSNRGFRCRIQIVDDIEDVPDVLRAIDCQKHVRSAVATAPASGQAWAIYPEVARGTTFSSVKGSPHVVLGGIRERVTVLSLGGETGTRPPSLTIVGPPAVIGVLPFGFGEVMNARGDVNGDGFGDLIVGIPGLDTVVWADRDVPMLERGGVFVFYGSFRFVGITGNTSSVGAAGIRDLKVPAARPEVTFLGENAGNRLGASVSAGRETNDNPVTAEVEDPRTVYFGVAMGAPFADADGRTDAGKVYAFRLDPFIEGRDWRTQGALSDSVYNFSDPDGPSGPLLSDHGDFEIWGAVAGDRLGVSVDLTGDYNGDSYVDLAVMGFGPSEEGFIDLYMVTAYYGEKPAGYSINPSTTGGHDGFPLQTINMGNIDVNRRVDLNGDGKLDPYEDRCVYCILDRAQPGLFGLPQVVVLGGPVAIIAPGIFTADMMPDGMDDLAFLVSTPEGSLPVVLNGNLAGNTPWATPELDVCQLDALANAVQRYTLEQDILDAVNQALGRPSCNQPSRRRGVISGRPFPQTGSSAVPEGNDGSGAVVRDPTSGQFTVFLENLSDLPSDFERMDAAVPTIKENTISVVRERVPDPAEIIWGPVIATGRPAGAAYLSVMPSGFFGAADVNGDGQGDWVIVEGNHLRILH